MKYEDLLARALEIQRTYDNLNTQHGRQLWSAQNYMAGFVGDVGDLSKIIMAKEGLRSMEQIDEKLAHELSDCLWSVMVLADKYGVDLPSEFMKNMDNLEKRITSA